MIGQCQSTTTNECLHITIRSSKSRISFFSNPCQNSNTTILINT